MTDLKTEQRVLQIKNKIARLLKAIEKYNNTYSWEMLREDIQFHNLYIQADRAIGIVLKHNH